MGAANLPGRRLADKFLYRALVLVNAHQCTKFQLRYSISFGDIKGGSKINKKMGATGLPGRPLAEKFLRRVLAIENAYKFAKFQLPSCISYGNMEGVPKYKLGATDLLRRP